MVVGKEVQEGFKEESSEVKKEVGECVGEKEGRRADSR